VLVLRLPEQRHAEGQKARDEAGDAEDDRDGRERVVVLVGADRRDGRGLVCGLVCSLSRRRGRRGLGLLFLGRHDHNPGRRSVRLGIRVDPADLLAARVRLHGREEDLVAGRRVLGHADADPELVEPVGRDGGRVR
jgi:hypothetical protein